MSSTRPPAEPISDEQIDAIAASLREVVNAPRMSEHAPVLVRADHLNALLDAFAAQAARLRAAEKRAKEDAEVMKAWGRQIVELQARLARLGVDSTEDER
jgi:hypothetical protein